MSKRDKSKKGGLWGWAFRKLRKSPIAWIGAAVGLLTGIPAVQEIPLFGAICMAAIFGGGAAGLAFAISSAVRAAHAQEGSADIEAARQFREEQEARLLEKLETVGLAEDKGVLAKMLEARDAIFKRCEGPDVDEKTSAPTLDLVSKVTSAAMHRAEELLDLTRRLNDSHLSAPDDAEAKVEACRADLVRGYQAVADSRSRILLYQEPSTEVFEKADKPALGSLAEQLEEETAVLEGIERRLRGLDAGPEISPPGSQDTSVTTYSSEMESD